MSRVERHAAEEAALGKRKEKDAGPEKEKGDMAPLGRFLNFLGSLILLAAILLCLVLAAPRLAGIRTYVVISGSMEPAIPTGSMVYSKEVDPKTLETGDVIVFYSSNAAPGGADTKDIIPITHRVVSNDTAAGEITTKGDANEQNDISKVTYMNVEGKVIFHVPHLGYLASPLSSTMGKISLALIILAGYLLAEAGSSMRKRSNRE